MSAAKAGFLDGASALSDESNAFRQRPIVGHDATAHIRAHGLLRIERKTSGPGEGARQPALVLAEHSLADILVHNQVMPNRKLVDRIHIADEPRFVHS